jgi:hypothetical protein
VSSPPELFAGLVSAFSAEPDVTVPGSPDATGSPGSLGSQRGFGSSALKVGGSIFAMLSVDQLVVKFPASRVQELIKSGEGESFAAGRGKPMKEWVAVATPTQWRALTEEAPNFVRKQ